MCSRRLKSINQKLTTWVQIFTVPLTSKLYNLSLPVFLHFQIIIQIIIMPTLKVLLQETNKLIFVKYLVLARHTVLYIHLLSEECYTGILYENKIFNTQILKNYIFSFKLEVSKQKVAYAVPVQYFYEFLELSSLIFHQFDIWISLQGKNRQI